MRFRQPIDLEHLLSQRGYFSEADFKMIYEMARNTPSQSTMDDYMYAGLAQRLADEAEREDENEES